MELAYGLSTSLGGADCWLGKLEEIKSAGITGLELCLNEDYESQRALLPAALDKIREHSMEIFSVHLPFGETVDIACPNEEIRQKAQEKVLRFVKLTGGLGAPRMVIHASYEPIPAQDRRRCLQASVRSLRVIAQALGELGITLAVEELPRTCLGNCAREMRWILSQVPGAGVCFDTNHLTLQTPEEFARQMADVIITTHISDYDGVNEKHWTPGDGIVPFRAIHQTLLAHGYTGPILFEPNEYSRGGVPVTPRGLVQGYAGAIR